MSGTTLRLATPLRPPLLGRDNGPGLRWLLFVQGCRRPCTTECLNPAFLDPRGGFPTSTQQVRLVADQMAGGTWGRVEGLTVLGGEPTDQAVAIREVLEHVHTLGLTVMLYSGRTLAWFRRSGHEAAERLLSAVDVLVDGPFVPRLAVPGLQWRGSTNQRFVRLTPRYSETQLSEAMHRKGTTLALGADGTVSVTGMQELSLVRAVEEILKHKPSS